MVDRLRLKQAIGELGPLYQKTSEKYSIWSAGFDDEPIDIESFNIKGVGLVNLPLEPNQVLEIVQKFPKKENQTLPKSARKSYCEIDGCEITVIQKQGGRTELSGLQDLTYKILQRMLDISFENTSFDLEAKLEKLIICIDKESYIACVNQSNEPDGRFGTLLLKLPLKMPSGRIVISDGTQKTKIDLRRNNGFSATAILGPHSCERKVCFTIDAGSGEMIAIMVFHLLWNNHLLFNQCDILPHVCFPNLLRLTNELKSSLASWEPLTGSKQETESLKQVHFLCLPASTYTYTSKGEDPDFDISKLEFKHKTIVKCLMSITFLDVHLASIGTSSMKTNADETSSTDCQEAKSSGAMLQFDRTIDFPHKIADNLSVSLIDAAKNLIDDISSYRSHENLGKPFPAIVIRPRNINYVPISKMKNKLKPEFFLESLTSRLDYYSERKLLSNPYVFKSLRKELEQLVDYSIRHKRILGLDPNVGVCPSCFFARFFDTCVSLNAEDLGTQVWRDALQDHSFKYLFHCWYNHEPSYDGCLATALSRFICFANGWEKYPYEMEQLMNGLLLEMRYYEISRIGLNLLDRGNLLGACKTFGFLVKIFRSTLPKPECYSHMFHVEHVVLALRLHKERPSNYRVALDLLLSGMENLEPSQLTGLLRHLGGLSEEGTLDCKPFMKKIGIHVVEIDFENFSPADFRDLIEAFKSIGDLESVKCFWKVLCIQCIKIFKSKQATTCLFCGLFKNSKSAEAFNAMVGDLNGFKGLNEAVSCSLQKLSRYPKQLDRDNCMEYINSLLLMEEHGRLSDVQATEKASALFSQLGPDVLNKLPRSLTKSETGKICCADGNLKKPCETVECSRF